MINYSLTVDNGELNFNNVSVSNKTQGPNYLPFNDSTTISLDGITEDQKHINFLDCIKDGTNEFTLLNLDLFSKNNVSPLTNSFKESLASYERNILKERLPFLESHSWSNLKQSKIKGKRSKVARTNYDNPFVMVNVVWDCGLSPGCYTINNANKNGLPDLRATFGSFIDPLCKTTSEDFGDAINFPGTDVTSNFNSQAMEYFGFGNSDITGMKANKKQAGSWTFKINLKIGEGCKGKGCKITDKNADKKYFKGNSIKSTILKSNLGAEEKVKYIVMKEFGDKMQVICFLMMYLNQNYSLMNTCDMVVNTLCLFLNIPCVCTGNHHIIDDLFNSSDYKKYRVIRYNPSEKDPVETYKTLYEKTRDSVMANNLAKIKFIKIIINKILEGMITGNLFTIDFGGEEYSPQKIIFSIILIEFENIQMNFEKYTQTIEHNIDIYKDAISILKPFYEIVSIFTAKSTIDKLKLIQNLQKFTVKGNTNKPYFDQWINSLPDSSIKSKISGRSSIGQIVKQFPAAAAGGRKVWKGGAAHQPAVERNDWELIEDDMGIQITDKQQYDDFEAQIFTWAVLWIEEVNLLNPNPDEEPQEEEPQLKDYEKEGSLLLKNQLIYIENNQYWRNKELPSGYKTEDNPLYITYNTEDYPAESNLILTNNKRSKLGSSDDEPLSIVSSPISYYLYDGNPIFVDKDKMENILNKNILDFLNDARIQKIVFNYPNTILKQLFYSYKKDSNLDNANKLLYSIQKITYILATEHAKNAWPYLTIPWEFDDEMVQAAANKEAKWGIDDPDMIKERLEIEYEETKKFEIQKAFTSLRLPIFEPTEFFDTTTEYSLERIVANGINLYNQQTTSLQQTGAPDYGLGAAEPMDEEERAVPTAAEAMEHSTSAYNVVKKNLILLFLYDEESAEQVAQRVKQEVFEEFMIGKILSVDFDEHGNVILAHTDNYGGGGSINGGSNKEAINTKISNEEAYALYLIYSGSDNSNVMPGIPLVNSPEEYQKNNELFYKYMSEIITNTSVSDSDHIKPLIKFKKDVKSEEESKNELAGEIKKNNETIETKKNLEKIDLDSLIDSRMPQEAPAAAAAAGGKKRKKRKTKKRRKKNKKTISNNKYLSKKTKRKKRRRKKSISNNKYN